MRFIAALFCAALLPLTASAAPAKHYSVHHGAIVARTGIGSWEISGAPKGMHYAQLDSGTPVIVADATSPGFAINPPFSGSADSQAVGPNQFIGIAGFNASTGMADRIRVDPASDAVTAYVVNNVSLAAGSTVQFGGSSYVPAAGTLPFAATACTSLKATPGRLARMNAITGTAFGSTVEIQLFDEGASPTCATADQIYDGPQLGAGHIVSLDWPLSAGLAAKFIVAPPANTGVRFSVY